MKRIIAFLIDGAIIIIPLQIIAVPLWNYFLSNHPDQLIFIAFSFQFFPFMIYYFISEYYFSRTIGKKIMKLEIVIKTNRLLSILIRTISRLIPFDPITFVLFKNKLLHDYLSNTKVISSTSDFLSDGDSV